MKPFMTSEVVRPTEEMELSEHRESATSTARTQSCTVSVIEASTSLEALESKHREPESLMRKLKQYQQIKKKLSVRCLL